MLAYRINWKNSSLEERNDVDKQLHKLGALYDNKVHLDRVDFMGIFLEETEIKSLDILKLPPSCTISRIN